MYGVWGVRFIDDDTLEAGWSLAFQGRKHVVSGEIRSVMRRLVGSNFLSMVFALVL